MKRRTPLAFLLLAAGPLTAAPVLSVGDTAPPLAVASWIKGGPIRLFEPGRVYVLEFWATWCGPCLANIPRLTALQKRLADRGVTVIGATSEDGWGNTEAAARKLVEAKGAALGYAIAWLPAGSGPDDRGIHRNPWFRAAGIQSLPTAFVLDREGRIAFIGDPASLDDSLDAIVSNRFDLGAARVRYAGVREAGKSVADFQRSIEQKDETGALRLAREIVAGPGRDDAHTMLVVAIGLSGSPWQKERACLDLALAAAERAVRLTKNEAPGMLDALARVFFLRGDVRKAVDAETRAVALSEGPMQDAQRKNLAEYKTALRD